MRVLIVDDSGFVRAYLRGHLEGMGADCAEAGNGASALQLLQSGECFDLMLVDWNMPVMNGLECLASLREQEIDPEMKIMVVTTEDDYGLIQSALECGADEFLMKPFTASSLAEKLMLLGLGRQP